MKSIILSVFLGLMAAGCGSDSKSCSGGSGATQLSLEGASTFGATGYVPETTQDCSTSTAQTCKDDLLNGIVCPKQ